MAERIVAEGVEGSLGERLRSARPMGGSSAPSIVNRSKEFFFKRYGIALNFCVRCFHSKPQG